MKSVEMCVINSSSAEEMVATSVNAVSSADETTLPETVKCASTNFSTNNSELLSKPSSTYIALIAKVILSSPSKTLNLAAIYRAMEERFPHIRSRGPGWRNSVRHNLSVNDCFVKVSRCEDGRGHYWGVHQAHLRDFEQGNFKRYRRARGRRERCNEVAQTDPSCLAGRFCESGSCLEPHCPLQNPQRRQLSSSDWIQSCYGPWWISAGRVQPPSWMKLCHLTARPTDSCHKATAGRGDRSQPIAPNVYCWDMKGLALPDMKESYDGWFMTPLTRAVACPVCWCVPPVIQESESLYHKK